MQINVKLHGVLREIFPKGNRGQSQIELADGATVADALAQLGIKRQVIVAINDSAESEKDQILTDGDHITVFSAVSGGSNPKIHIDQELQNA